MWGPLCEEYSNIEVKNLLKMQRAVKKYWDKSMCDEHALFLTPYDTIWNGFGQF